MPLYRRSRAVWLRALVAVLLALVGALVPVSAGAAPAAVPAASAAGARAHVSRANPARVTAVRSAALPAAGLTMAFSVPRVGVDERDGNDLLLGTPERVRFAVKNTTSTDHFNATYRVVLPSTVTNVSATVLGSEEPWASGQSLGAAKYVYDRGDGTTVYIWENVADLLQGVTNVLDVTGTWQPVGTAHAVGEVYVNSSPNYVPDFYTVAEAAAENDKTPRPSPKVYPGDVRPGASLSGGGSDSATGQVATTGDVEVVPFTILKHVAAPEHEVLRGVHDNRYTTTLTIKNNGVGDSTLDSVVDYLPADLEFLGCGDVDHSKDEEYTGSGSLNKSDGPSDCDVPATVETVTLTAPQAAALSTPGHALGVGVYTKVTWTGSELARGATRTISYLVGAPEKANTATWPGTTPAADGSQGANLDNNTGAPTAEPGGERSAIGAATATGSYDGKAATARDTETVSIEDLALQKSGPGNISIGSAQTWTLNAQISEYTSAWQDVTITDTVPDGLCPVGMSDGACGGVTGDVASPAFDTATYNADGTIKLTWNAQPPNGTSSGPGTTGKRVTLTSQAVAMANYRVRRNGGPVLANDTWTNAAHAAGHLTDRNPAVGTRDLIDDSSSRQVAHDVAFTKEVAAPVSGSCDPTGALDWKTGTGTKASLLHFGPGDHVCWRLTLRPPETLKTNTVRLTDTLPQGHGWVNKWVVGPSTGRPTDGSGETWTPGTPNGAQRSVSVSPHYAIQHDDPFVVVLESTIIDPKAAQPEDIVDNLAKGAYQDTAGTSYQVRDAASVVWDEPRLTLDKTAYNVTKNAATSAAADDAGDVIRYTLTLTNTGNRVATDVGVWDRYAPRMGCPSTMTLGGAANGTLTATCADAFAKTVVPSIAPGQTVTLTYSMTLPTDTAPGERFVNTAYVTRFTAASNQTTPFVFVPEGSPDTAAGTPNTEPLAGTAALVVQAPGAGIAKAATTAVTEDGNTATQATVGERIDYTVTVTVPADTTLPAGTTVTDALPPGLRLLATPTPAVTSTDFTPDGDWKVTADLSTADGTVTLRLPEVINPDQTPRTFALTYSARALDNAVVVAGANLVNTATLAYTKGLQTFRGSATARVPVVEPDIGVAMTAGDTLTAGGTVPVHLTVTNAAGASVAHDTLVSVAVPAGLTCPAPVPTLAGQAGTCADGRITWTLRTLDPGASATVDLDLGVPNPLVLGADYRIEGAAETRSLPEATEGERVKDGVNPLRYRESVVRIPGQPQLTQTKTASPATVAVGQDVTFTIRSTVPAGATIHDLVVFDQFPKGLRVKGTPTGTCGSGDTETTSVSDDRRRVMWWLDEAATGDRSQALTCDLTVVATVLDGTPAVHDATLLNQAWVAGRSTDGGSAAPAMPDDALMGSTVATMGPRASSTAGVTVHEPRLGLAKVHHDADGRIHAGEAVSYTLTVSNTADGSASGYDTTVVDTLPTTLVPDLTDDGSSVTGTLAGGGTVSGAWDATAHTITWPVGTLAPHASAAITYTVRGGTGIASDQPVTNTAVARTTSRPGSVDDERSATSSTNGGRYTASAGTSIGPDSITVTKTADVAQAAPGSVVTYTAKAVLPAGVRFYDLALTDTMPVGVDYVGTTSVSCETDDGSSCDLDVKRPAAGTGSPVRWWLGDLAGDARARVVTVVFTGRVAAGVTRTSRLTNTIQAQWNTTNTIDESNPPNTPSFGYGSPLAKVETQGIEPVVVLTKTVDQDGTGVVRRHATPGQVLVYTVTAENTGTADAYDVRLEDVRSAKLGTPTTPCSQENLGGATLTPETTSRSTTTRVFTLPHLARGATATVRYCLQVDAGVTSADDIPDAFDLANSVDATYASQPAGTPQRAAYDDVIARTTGIELDLPSGLSGNVWLDQDADRAIDAEERRLSGVTVHLSGPGGFDHTLTTDAQGHWQWEGYVPTGTYTVTVTGLPGGTHVDSFLHQAVPNPMTFTMNNGVRKDDIDIGLVGDHQLGDRVWWDANRNGLQESNETGISGVGVQAVWAGQNGTLGDADDVTYDTTTGTDGAYEATGLPEGKYRVSAIDGVGAYDVPTWDLDSGPYSGSGSAGSAADRRTVDLTIGTDGKVATATGPGVGGVAWNTVDFGFVHNDLTLGDTVWQDLDGSGTFTAGEGVPGVTVRATWAGLDGVFDSAGGGDDHTWEAITADADGHYHLTGLPPGEYRVTIETPSNLQDYLTAFVDLDGGDATTTHLTLSPTGESGAVVTGGAVSARTGDPQTPTTTWAGHDDVDFGLKPLGQTVTGTVWIDLNGDGTHDPGEPGLPGATVHVCFQGGTSNCTDVTTGPDGTWHIDHPPAGPVTATVTVPGGTTTPKAGTIPTGGTTDLPVPVTYRFAALGDTVWRDDDRDFVADAGEPPAAGVVVTAVWAGLDGHLDGEGGVPSTDDVTFTTTTDAQGHYALLKLPPGAYRVRIDHLPSGWLPLRDADGGDPLVTLVSLDGDQRVDDVDFALVLPPVPPVRPRPTPTTTTAPPTTAPPTTAPPTTAPPTGGPTTSPGPTTTPRPPVSPKPTTAPTPRPTSSPTTPVRPRPGHTSGRETPAAQNPSRGGTPSPGASTSTGGPAGGGGGLGPGPLPFTGAELGAMSAAGLALVGLGLLLVRRGRRRRS